MLVAIFVPVLIALSFFITKIPEGEQINAAKSSIDAALSFTLTMSLAVTIDPSGRVSEYIIFPLLRISSKRQVHALIRVSVIFSS